MTIRQQKMEKAKLQTANVLHPSMPLVAFGCQETPYKRIN